MSAFVRKRRARRAGRVHQVLDDAIVDAWVLIVVLRIRPPDPDIMRLGRRALVARGWTVGRVTEDGVPALIARRTAPHGAESDAAEVGAWVMRELGAAVDDEELSVLDVAVIDDVILLPPGAMDSDLDLLWLDPLDSISIASRSRSGAIDRRMAITRALADRRAHWERASDQADTVPDNTSLSDALF